MWTYGVELPLIRQTLEEGGGLFHDSLAMTVYTCGVYTYSLVHMERTFSSLC
jgi:hypothetical protein